jgi:short-subunit dehydrogenase
MNNTHTVLITGATSGIGLELARFFARDHYTLAIVSRETQKAEQTARELKAAGATDVHVITADLAEPTGPEQVFAATKKAGLHIDILVNDAGVGVHGKFAETDLQEEIRIVQLNVISLVHLTKLYLREMLPKKKGRILQLASVASYQPTPLLAVYAATKAFVLSFSDAIANELEGTGITVTSLIPGPTDTDFFRKADAEHTKAAQDNPEVLQWWRRLATKL